MISNSFKLYLLFILCVGGISQAAGQTSLDSLRSAYIVKFIEHVTWGQSKSRSPRHIGVLVQDGGIYDSLNHTSSSKRGTPSLVVKRVTNLNHLDGLDALFVGRAYVGNIQEIYEAVERKNILLITDQCEDGKYIMINLVKNAKGDRLSFQINKTNAILEGLNISPKLILLGGSEIDVRELYRQMKEDFLEKESKLTKQKRVLSSLQSEMKQHQVNMDEFKQKVQSLSEYISHLKKETDEKQTHIQQQAELISEQIKSKNKNDIELKHLSDLLRKEQKQIDLKQVDLENQKKESLKLSVLLKNVQKMIDAKQDELSENKKTIKEHVSLIHDQEIAMILGVILLILFITLIFSVYRAYRIKYKSNVLLEERVARRTIDLNLANKVLAKEITDRKVAEKKELQHREKTFESSKLASLGTLMAGVGHEINNPNEFIMLNAPMLKEVWLKCLPVLEKLHKAEPVTLLNQSLDDVKSDITQLYDDISQGSRRIQGIVRDLKDYAKPDEGGQKNEIYVNQIIHVSVSLLKNNIEKSTNYFKKNISEDLPIIYGNRQQLEQVVINLLQNACQSLQSRDKKVEVYSRLSADGRFIVVGVKDEGSGISPENLSQIKDPFFTTKRDLDGMGLGLAISSRIVEDHGGELNFESEVGRGTEAILQLPTEQSL